MNDLRARAPLAPLCTQTITLEEPTCSSKALSVVKTSAGYKLKTGVDFLFKAVKSSYTNVLCPLCPFLDKEENKENTFNFSCQLKKSARESGISFIAMAYLGYLSWGAVPAAILLHRAYDEYKAQQKATQMQKEFAQARQTQVAAIVEDTFVPEPDTPVDEEKIRAIYHMGEEEQREAIKGFTLSESWRLAQMKVFGEDWKPEAE